MSSGSVSDATLEVLGGLGQVGVAHQVLPVLELAALLQEAFGACLCSQVRIGVLIRSGLRQVVPVDLELGHTGFLSEDVAVEALDHRLSRRVLIELSLVVLNVDVVADAKELLIVLVAARQEHSSDTDDVRHGESRRIRSITLIFDKKWWSVFTHTRTKKTPKVSETLWQSCLPSIAD